MMKGDHQLYSKGVAFPWLLAHVSHESKGNLYIHFHETFVVLVYIQLLARLSTADTHINNPTLSPEMVHCVFYLADSRVRQRETRPRLWDQTHTYLACTCVAIMQIASQVYTRISDMCCTNKSAWQLCCTYQSQCWGLARAHGYTTATMVGGQMSWLALKQLYIIPWWWPGGHQHQPLAECPVHQSVLLDWRYRVDWHHPVEWESMKWGLLPGWKLTSMFIC